jgi:hypothetical protein
MGNVNSISGAELIDMTNANLAGYQGAVSPTDLLIHLNEAKDEIWMLLKELNEDYFAKKSQYTTASDEDYFGPMSTTVREYDLPLDLREIRFIEILNAGYEQVNFTYRSISHPDFSDLRRQATAQQSSINSPGGLMNYFYTIIGKNKLVLAQYPEAAFDAVIWYVRNLPDFDTGETVDEILFPYSKKLAEYAAYKILLSLNDTSMWEAWKREWKDSVMHMMASADQRNSADPQFVISFEG